MIRVAAIVLSGGRSSRMGRPKAWLPFGDEAMLQRVVRLLSDVVRPIVVVAAPGQELPELPADVRIVRDEREGQGPLEGLRGGLQALVGQADAAYATGCDVPLLEPAFVRFMIEQLTDHEVAVPVDGPFHHPLAAVYRRNVLPHLDALLAAGRLRPVFLYEQVRTRRVSLDALRTVDPDLDTLRNLNHPEDYERALADFRRRRP